MKKMQERLRKIEQKLPPETEQIKDVIRLEDERFMCTPSPYSPFEGETFELPILVPPGSLLEKYCKEVYEKGRSERL